MPPERPTRPVLRTATRLARAALVAGALVAAAALPRAEELARTAPAEDETSRELPDGEADVVLAPVSDRERAVTDAYLRGVAWLVESQAASLDGSMAVGARVQTPVPIATTALGALALMAGGSAYGRGPHGREVARAVDYLLAHCNLDEGDPEFGYIGRKGAPEAIRMHSHGFATLALAEAYSTSPHSAGGRQLGEALEAAVRLIEHSQGGEGGWFYNPRRSPRHEGSVTICLVQALRAARNAGIRVDPGTVSRAEKYVLESQRDNGLFAYELYDPDAHTSVALTAAGVSTLYSLGEYAGPHVERGMAAIWRELNAREIGEGQPPRFPCYERLYLAQAMWQHGETEHFERWSRMEFDRLLADQASDGHWQNDVYGDAYATAINCLVLAMSQELLPIFQR